MRGKDFNLSVVKQNLIFYLLIAYGAILILIGLLADSINDIFVGLIKIVLSPSNLVSDYIQIAGVGATFINSGSLTLLSLLILRRYQYSVTSLTISVIMMLSGFSFFGKNLLNSIPIILGALLYIKITHSEQQEDVVVGLLGTCLSPLVSIIFLNNSISYKIVSFLAGLFIGFVIVPIFNYMKNHTRGLNLYNMGFSAGIVGVAGNLITRKILQIKIIPHSFHTTYSNDLFIILVILFSTVFTVSIYGLLMTQHISIKNRSLVCTQQSKIFTFYDIWKLVKFSLYGFFALITIKFLGVQLSAPVVGTIITFAGFSMYDFNFVNYFVPATGAMSASYLIYGDITSTTSIVIIFFASTLSPYAQKSGMLASLFAGGVFSIISREIGVLHAGINLYNCGFAGGITVLLFYFFNYLLRTKLLKYKLIDLLLNQEKLSKDLKTSCRMALKKIQFFKLEIDQLIEDDQIDN